MERISLLLIIIHTLLPMFEGEVINIVTIDERVSLRYQQNSSMRFTWSITAQGNKYTVFIFHGTVNSQCEGPPFLLPDSDFTASWNGNCSVFSFLQPKISVEMYSCEQSGEDLRTYNVTFVNPDDITDPVCNVAAASQIGELQVTLSCEYNISRGFVGCRFGIEGTGKTSSTKLLFTPYMYIIENLDYDTFLNITNAVCVLSVSSTQTTLNRSCQYPKAVNIEKTIIGNDVAISCDVESNSEVAWIVYDSDGRKIDIKNISWTRDGGRSLLIRGVPSNDLESKVVECRTYRDGSKSMIGYTTINTFVDENTDDKVPLIPTLESSNDSVFFVPTLLFLTLWLITSILFGLLWWRKSMERKPSPSSMSTISDPIGQTPKVNQSNTNGGNGAHDTPLDNIETHSHRHAESY